MRIIVWTATGVEAALTASAGVPASNAPRQIRLEPDATN
jgi:hypothetical protein